ncbi:hypothetical protein V2J09_008997 [Rumex salicifolius]
MERYQGSQDTVVPETLDLDANMEDYGTQPPGDPSDDTKTWAERVAGGGEGGMPVPELVLDDEFVASRMQITFPNGEDGKPEITIGKDVLDVMAGLWKQCMVVKVLGRKVSLATLDRRLRELWKPRGGMFVVDLPRQFFMVRFEDEQDYFTALTGGPWKVFGSYLLVQAWSPEFDPSCDDIVTKPVWVRLSNIPMTYYHRTILMGIASSLGKPIRVDSTTLRLERARFARECVEVNLKNIGIKLDSIQRATVLDSTISCVLFQSIVVDHQDIEVKISKKVLKGTILVNGERYFVSYEGLNTICSSCGIYGHLSANCPQRRTNAESSTTKNDDHVKTAEPENEGGRMMRGDRKSITSGEEAFVPVRNPARKGDHQNLRDNGKAKITEDNGIIRGKNRFASLAGDQEDSVKESRDMEEGEKESLPTAKILEKSGTEPILVDPGINDGTLKPLFLAGKDKRAKPKTTKNNKPGRGLIFGSVGGTKDDVQIGKRLRTEVGGTSQNRSLQNATNRLNSKTYEGWEADGGCPGEHPRLSSCRRGFLPFAWVLGNLRSELFTGGAVNLWRLSLFVGAFWLARCVFGVTHPSRQLRLLESSLPAKFGQGPPFWVGACPLPLRVVLLRGQRSRAAWLEHVAAFCYLQVVLSLFLEAPECLCNARAGKLPWALAKL